MAKVSPLIPLLLFLSMLQAGSQADPQIQGLQALDKGQYADAERIFSQMAERDPKDYSAVFNLALAETALKKDEQAVGHYRRSLELKPDLFEAELNLGILLLRLQRNSEASPLLQTAAKQRPGQPKLQRYLGDSYLVAGDYTAAAEAYGAALRPREFHVGLVRARRNMPGSRSTPTTVTLVKNSSAVTNWNA